MNEGNTQRTEKMEYLKMRERGKKRRRDDTLVGLLCLVLGFCILKFGFV